MGGPIRLPAVAKFYLNCQHVLVPQAIKEFRNAHNSFLIFAFDAVVAKLWPEKTYTIRYVGPTICNETGNGPKSALAATSLIVID